MLKISHYESVTRIDLARTIAGRGRYWTTAYLVDGILVDSGCAHCAQELTQALADEHLSHIVNTHSHEDHIGANGPLQRFREGLEILAHPLALPVLENPRRAQPLQPYRRAFWGWPEPSSGQPLDKQTVIETEHHQFQVIYTPGHSSDHICLYEPQRGWLFSGDLFVGGRERALRAGYNIWEIISSLKTISGVQTRWLFPGCARVRENPADDLKTKIAYLEDLGEQVLELHQGGSSVNEIVRALLGGPMWIEFATLGHFSRRRLVRSYLGKNSSG